jgi:serine-type D-Ala-D-Ala carboxypeptidase (penicillin-binding protein 5/6)
MTLSSHLLRHTAILAVAATLSGASAALAAPPTIETAAREAILIDYDTGTVMFEKNADERTPPSSMSKLMTAYMVIDRLQKGDLKLTDELPVSPKAWKMGGSKMFVMVNTKVSVSDLLHGVIIQSGNDATVVLAEGLAGSEEAFAEQATELGRKIGLTNSNFRNASGWPEDGHYMTVRDIATLSWHTIHDHPEFYPLYKQKDFTYNKIKQGNRNPLLYDTTGADGLKTGHTEAAGYGLAASIERNGRRIILVVNGLKSMQQRADETRKLTEFGFREYENYRPFRAGETVAEADVWLGTQAKVPLVVDTDAIITLPRSARTNAKIVAQYTGPIAAPIARGDTVGQLVIESADAKTVQIPLKAGASVERLGLMGRIGAAFNHLLWGAS